MFSSVFFVLNLQTASAKPSLLAALNKSSKQVSRTGSDVSTQSSKCELCSVMNTLFQGYMETLLTVRKSVGNGENIHLLFFYTTSARSTSLSFVKSLIRYTPNYYFIQFINLCDLIFIFYSCLVFRDFLCLVFFFI